MSSVPNSFDYPSHDDKDLLRTTANAAPDGEWLLPVVETTVGMVSRRIAATHEPDGDGSILYSVKFVQEAYADLQELTWDRQVADATALKLFRQRRPPSEPWSDFMKQRIVELTPALAVDVDDELHREFMRLCLVLVFFHSCRHRHDADGVLHSLELFEAFLGPARGRRDFPIYGVMEFYASCMQFERQMLGDDVGAACPTADGARKIVALNRELEPPTQPEEAVLAAIARIAGVGRPVVVGRSAAPALTEQLPELDRIVEYGLELVQDCRDRDMRYFPAQAAAQLHAWRGDMDRALGDASEAVRCSSAQPLAFWLPEVMRLRSIVTERNRDATERLLDDKFAQAEAGFSEQVEQVKDELNSKVAELSERLETEAREVSDDASRRAIVPVIEVLGVFVAVLAVAASSVGAAVASGLGFWQRIAIIAAGSVGALLVLGMVRLQVRPSRRLKS